MHVFGSVGVAVVFFLSMNSARAADSCSCTVEIGNQNRAIWGSWAVECNGHAGHDDCPTTNIDTMHSPGASAMVGTLSVQARSDNSLKGSWSKSFSDDHVTAFKGPVILDGWEWT